MKILLPLIAIFFTSIYLGLTSDRMEADYRVDVSEIVTSNLRLYEVEIYLKTHFSNIDYAVSPKKSSSGIVSSFNNFSTISRSMGLSVQTLQELITPSILQIKLTNKTV